MRMSGAKSLDVAHDVFIPAGRNSSELKDHTITYGKLMDGEEQLDECMAVYMRSPRSYTCEDVVEFQLHSGLFVLNRIVELCVQHGARLAEPGEFTRRAFLNGRIDLSEAEAVMRLISAQGQQEQRAAIRQMNGGAASFIRNASDQLYRLQAGLAACIDYPEEISDQEGSATLKPGLERLIHELKSACSQKATNLLFHGLRVALIGRPNVGKSSLLNAFIQENRAIVTSVPGTTRDLVHGDFSLNGFTIHMTDTAGVRETDDPVEKEGVRRSRKAADEADLLFLVLDGSEPLTDEDTDLLDSMDRISAILISKGDLPAVIRKEDPVFAMKSCPVFRVSSVETDSLEPVREFLKRYTEETDLCVFTQPRHLDAVNRAVDSLENALKTLEYLTPDMASTDLQEAQAALSEITGDRMDEVLLDTVFSQFCVGK